MQLFQAQDESQRPLQTRLLQKVCEGGATLDRRMAELGIDRAQLAWWIDDKEFKRKLRAAQRRQLVLEMLELSMEKSVLTHQRSQLIEAEFVEPPAYENSVAEEPPEPEGRSITDQPVTADEPSTADDPPTADEPSTADATIADASSAAGQPSTADATAANASPAAHKPSAANKSLAKKKPLADAPVAEEKKRAKKRRAIEKGNANRLQEVHRQLKAERRERKLQRAAREKARAERPRWHESVSKTEMMRVLEKWMRKRRLHAFAATLPHLRAVNGGPERPPRGIEQAHVKLQL